MKKLYKLFLVLCLMCTGVIFEEKSINSYEAKPYAASALGPIYGRCNSAGRIVIVYMGVVTSSGNGTYFSSIVPEGAMDHSIPFVVYKYTDNKGSMSIPYYHLNYNANSVYEDVGDFGACPF